MPMPYAKPGTVILGTKSNVIHLVESPFYLNCCIPTFWLPYYIYNTFSDEQLQYRWLGM